MNKKLLLKLIIIGIYLFISIFYFYDEHFPSNTKPLYSYGNIPFMATSISFGIIISATLYNIALFFYLKSQEYLLYALAQLASLFFLINLDSLFISPFDDIFGLKSFMLFDFSNLLMITFSLLFLKSFFKNYHLNQVDKLIQAILYLVFIDLIILIIFSHILIFKFLPTFIPILLILSEALKENKNKDLPFKLVVLGWLSVIVVVLSEYLGILHFFNIYFPFFHLAIALESILLSLAIAYKFKLLSEEKEEQQMLLFQQSRLASVGTMISSIAHQWRQPLNVLSFGLMNIKKYSNDEKSLHIIRKLNEQIQYMSQTIEDFRNFYNPSKVRKEFDIYETCQESVRISNTILEQNNIQINIVKKNNFTLIGFQNELEQVLVTLISNAKDAFIQNKIENAYIVIKINQSNISILDNAGGIEAQTIKKIFTPYFSTKKESDGIGLYISKLIIEKEFKGKISVHCFNKKTLFTLKFKESKSK